LRIVVTEETKFAIVEAAQKHFRETRNVIDVDGARVKFDGGWGLLRASNTQPILVARYEAETEEQLYAIRGEMESWLRTKGVEV